MDIIVKAGQGDGKTTIAGFLAQHLSDAGFAVCIVDGNRTTEIEAARPGEGLPGRPRFGLPVERIILRTASYPEFDAKDVKVVIAGQVCEPYDCSDDTWPTRGV